MVFLNSSLYFVGLFLLDMCVFPFCFFLSLILTHLSTFLGYIQIKELDNIIRCLYEDRVCGRLSPERYDVMASGYEQEQAELKQELQSITKRIDEMGMREMCIREFIAKAKEYLEMPKLTPELLRVFIRRIEVYEKLEKYSRNCGNPIVIHYAFQLPEQNGMPAIEKVMQPATMSA